MNSLTLRGALCYLMVSVLPSTLLGAEPRAMVYVSGSTAVNGTPVPRSSVVFPGDLIQTQSASQANINLGGASVTIFEGSSVRVENRGLSIEAGSVNVGTPKPDMTVRAGAVTVTPASGEWTEFEVRHLNGAVQVIARKGDLSVSDGNETMALPQGQSATRDDSAVPQGSENEKKRKKRDGPAAAASAPVLDSPIVIGAGAGAIGVGLIYVLTRSGAPPSPSVP
jgi:hypothetical protein